MKKIFIILGCIALILIAIAAAFVFHGRQLDASSKSFIDTNISGFFSTLSKDVLLKISIGEARQNISSENANLLFLKLKQLGKFQKYEGSKGEANITFNYSNGTVVTTADYLASASYQNSHVEMDIKLIRNNGQWQMTDFAIFSPLFIK